MPDASPLLCLLLVLLTGILVSGCSGPGERGGPALPTTLENLPPQTSRVDALPPPTLETPATVPPAIAAPATKDLENIAREYRVSGQKMHTFVFDGRNYSVTTDVREGYIERSREALARFPGPGRENDPFQEELYQWMVLNTSQDLLYEDILTDVRAYRDRYRLDDSTYVELLVAYVQSFEYQSPSGYTRLPVEVVMDEKGDCDERACLLAGLLHAEGFDTVLIGIRLKNGKIHHMGAGIRSTGFRFSSTDYTFLETTTPFPIGYSPYDTRTMKLHDLTQYYFTKTGIAVDEMADQPLVYKMGTGGKKYGNGAKAQDIYNAALRLEAAHLKYTKELETQEAIVADYEGRLRDCVKTYGCSSYDTYLWMYGDALSTYNTLVDRHNAIAELYGYLLGNTDSIDTIHTRVGVWAYSDIY